jgi:tRNA(His) guanylyltransferase
MLDSLGDRMKANYEGITRHYLPRRTYVIIRIDGKAFHTLTKGCERPYDTRFMAAMDATTVALCEQIQNVQLAYTQSDEISLLLTDFASVHTAQWFDGNIQKITSVSASIAAAHFNDSGFISTTNRRLAYFDSRVFTIPDPTEVYNYFVWRQEDATRNSIQMLGQAHFSPKELHGKGCGYILGMLLDKNIDWTKEPVDFRLGRFLQRQIVTKDVEYTHKKTGEQCQIENAVRHEWVKADMPFFKHHPEWLQTRIPKYP